MVGVNSPSIGWGEALTWRPPDRRGRSPVTTWSLAERGLRLLSASFSPLARSKRRTTKVVWGTMEAMVQGDPRTAGSGPPDPAAPATPGSDGNGTASQGARRRRYGRRRGTVPVGDCFDTRLIGRTSGEDFDADNIDTSRLAGKLWDLRDTIGLERLCAELGVTHRQPHHALADAEATAACFLELVVRGRERFGWRTLGDLLADGTPPVRPPAPTSSERRRRPRLPAAGTAVAVAVDGEDPAAPSRPRRRRGRRRRGRDGVNGNGIGNDHAPGNGGEVPPPPV